MKKLYIVANWKSNKTRSEVDEWFHGFELALLQDPVIRKEVILCPSFVYLPRVKQLITEGSLPISMGALNVSSFGSGAYTGEVNAIQLKDYVQYVIIGHSERRKNFGETDDIVNQKLGQAFENNLIPILCVSNIEQVISAKLQVQSYNSKIKIIAYEPVAAIGTGNPDTPQKANEMAMAIQKELGDVPVLYGGSVTAENVHSFAIMEQLNGVLVGKASLDPHEFSSIITNA